MPRDRYTPGYSPSLPRAAVAGATANPYEGLLSSIERAGEKVAMVGAEQGAERRVFAGENPGLSLGLTDVQRVFNRAAEAAYQARTEGQVRAKVAELGAKYTGLNPTDPQGFAQEFDEFAGAITGSVPEQIRGRIAGELQIRRDIVSAEILNRANDNELRRNAQAINLGWKQDVDDAASAAQLGRDDLVDAALLKASEKQQQLVELGLVSPETAALRDREGREEVAVRTLFRGFMDGAVSLEAVQSGEIGEGLSAPARDWLVGRMEAELAHQRSEANHAMAVVEANVRAQSRDLKALSKKQDAGIPLTAEETARRDAYLNTPGAVDPDAYEDGVVSKQTFGLSRDVATMTPEQIEAHRAKWAAEPPRSMAEVGIRERALKAFDARESGLATDPAAYASSVMPEHFPPVVLPADPADPAFESGLAQAANNARLLRAQYGVDANPLTKAEQGRFAATVASLPAEKQADALAKIDRAFGPDSDVIFDGLAKAGAKVQAHAGSVARFAPDVGASILRGSEALRLDVAKAPTEIEVLQRGATLSSAFPLAPGYQGQLLSAAKARAADLAIAAGDPQNTAGYLDQALEDVGGGVAKWGTNASVVALPIGVTQSEFSDRLEAVTDTEIAAMAGNVGHLGPVADEIRAGRARLESLGEGRYFVTVGTERVTLPNGAPFVLDYQKIGRTPKGVLLTTADEVAE